MPAPPTDLPDLPHQVRRTFVLLLDGWHDGEDVRARVVGLPCSAHAGRNLLWRLRRLLAADPTWRVACRRNDSHVYFRVLPREAAARQSEAA